MRKFMFVVLSLLLVFTFSSVSFSADKAAPAVVKVDDKTIVPAKVEAPVKAEVKAAAPAKATEVKAAVPVKVEEKAAAPTKVKKAKKVAKKTVVKPVDDKSKTVVPAVVAPAIVPAK